jgi:hypothetical protein
VLGSTAGVSGEGDRSGVAAGVEKVLAKRLSMIDGMYVVCQVRIDNHVDVVD